VVSPTRTRSIGLVVVAVVAIGLVLRGPIIAVAPVIGDVRGDLAFTAAQAGLLTSLPVLCFAVLTPVASVLIARVGPDLATTIGILGVILGIVVRSAGDAASVFTGTLIMGAFITVGNVVVPVLIRRDVPPERARSATAFYTSALNFGSVIATAASAPLAQAFGWRVSLAGWAVLTLVVLVVWVLAGGRDVVRPVLRGRSDAAGAADDGPVGRRERTTGILLCLGFAGQAFAYYGVTAWLPTLLEDELGYDATAAGSSAAVFQLAGLIGTIGVPLLARRGGLLPVAVATGALWLVVPIGLIVSPGAWFVWSVLGGAAQGAGITLVFILVVEIAVDGGHARRLSALSQGVGYLLGGATAPTVLGAVHDATGGWSAPMLVVIAAVVVFGVLATITVLRTLRPADAPADAR
jgi:MFS transporter, CP family, cyanate transporter